MTEEQIRQVAAWYAAMPIAARPRDEQQPAPAPTAAELRAAHSARIWGHTDEKGGAS